MWRAALFVVGIAMLSVIGSPALAQTRPAFFDQPSVIERVGTIAPLQRVPLIVLLPPTGGDARWVTPPSGVGPCVLLITPGQPARSDYLPAFSHYLDWVEARVMADVGRALAEQPIDPERIYLAGFSLGVTAQRSRDDRGARLGHVRARCDARSRTSARRAAA